MGNLSKICGRETPCDYHCNFGPDNRRRDADERPELCRGTVEFVATKDYMVRYPMPAVFFFLVDVSMNAVQTGATSAASSAISQAIADVHAANLAMKSTGGKLLVFQSVLPLIGFGALSTRGIEGRSNISAGEKVQEAHKLLQPADKMLKTMAIEFAEFQVSVDIFITTQTYVDIASISVVPRTTGGQVYYYHPFSAGSDSAKLYNDLRWNVSRLQRLEAVMRVRCSQGLQVQEYLGNFCKRIPTDVDLPAIDCDNGDLQT